MTSHVTFWIFFLAVCPWSVSTNDGYLIVAPSVFRPGVRELISVTILHPTAPITVESKLITDKGEIIAHEGREIFGKGSLVLEVPMNAKGLAQLKVCGNCLSTEKRDYSFFNSSSVVIEKRRSVLFIDTDKPMYKPGQTVYITAITTGIDLKPVNEDVLLYIEDGHGTRVAQWTKLPEICKGVYEVSLPLSSQPVLGQWMIYSEVRGHDYNRSFTVEKYVLPRYTVDIQPPSYFRDWTRCEEFTVTARYVYNQPVHGRLIASASLKGLGYYSDYQGETIVIDQTIDGSTSFNLCIADLIRNEVGDHFRGHVDVEAEVVTPDGKSVRASDGTCAVNKQLVDVAFSSDTRKNFKPGIPFKGKVNVMYPDGSPAENVTILLRTDVNGGNFSAKVYDVISGAVHFEIPELPVASNVVWIEAKVLQVSGRDVANTYLSSHMSITGWYSPSKCHVLVQAKDSVFRVGKDARFSLLSTCPCNFTLFFEVISRGNIVHSGIHYSHHHDKRDAEVRFTEQTLVPDTTDDRLCSTHFKFTVTPKMAPLSRLLVYYVRENGEGVADATTLNIEPSFENKLVLLTSIKEALPGDSLELTSRTKPDSCVCLTATDKSLHYLGNNKRLNTDMIFDEMREFDVTLTGSEAPYWWGLSSRYRRSLDLWSLLKNKDAKFAFEEAGMLVMTDRVRLHHGKDLGSISGPVFHRPGYLPAESLEVFMRGMKHRKANLRKRRTYFPDMWFRKCYNTTSSSKYHSFWTTIPDSLTTWVVNGFSVSTKDGLSVARSIEVTTAKSFFSELALPYSVIRGEQVKIPITVHNYYDYCTEVYINIRVPESVTLLLSSENTKQIAVCIGKNTSVTKSFAASFSGPGVVNITAITEGYPSLRCCSGTPTTNWSLIRRKIVGYDHVTRSVRVEPEGILKEYTNSVFLCPKESLHVSTPAAFVVQYLPKPRGMTAFSFTVRAVSSAHLRLTSVPGDTNHVVEILIGGNGNSLSSISRGKSDSDQVTAHTPNVLTMEEYRAFWVSWEGGRVRVGLGSHINYQQLMSLDLHEEHTVEYIGFATSSGVPATFKIWTDSEGTYGEVFHLGIPANHVKGSARAEVKLIGDTLGSTMRNLDQLIRLPHGCGEQNMVYFAPNIHVLKYLKLTEQLLDDVQEKALYMLTKGYQRQLTYQRWDGSYSVFGEKDASGSMWLTAFVLKSLIQAKEFIYIDQTLIERTENWMLSYQEEDGSFPNIGRVINKELQSGAHSAIPLTAYVLTSLLELPRDDDYVQSAIERAKSFLEGKVSVISDPYTAALCSYALSLVNSDMALMALRKLNQMALTTDDMKFWKISGRPVQKDVIYTFQDGLTKSVSSAEVEVAAYALLTYSTRGDVTSALPVVKWLSRKRNAWGGFSSTHDTSIALYALSKFATLVYSGQLNMSVTLASTNLDLQQKLTLHPGNSDVVQSVPIPTLPTGLFVSAVGDGCALLQVDVEYNIPDPSSRQSFHVTVNVRQTRKGDNQYLSLEICSRWIHAGSSNMAVTEVVLLSGFEADTETLDELLITSENVKRYEVNKKTVVLYMDEISSRCRTCVSFSAIQIFKVGKITKGSVKVYDYYEPAYEAISFYSATKTSGLTGSICEGGMCNEIYEGNEEEISETESCSSPNGCHEKSVPKCHCYKECTGSLTPVCGTDGVMYDGICELKMAACSRDIVIDMTNERFCDMLTREKTKNGLDSIGDEMDDSLPDHM
ncbi:C3 and PZP-like alpha-2-macroglobulin domain-containing protein 8 [Liolophura sinensis]|uniref:C3 and PZP-like alpha-2-macroglobulin domain-containing protein 8 n=1 Tax=Liolophura sinensis TaxID=3198878 RepID=UPI0031583BC2